jgi:uncharacterized protein (UPF0147 family)
MRGKFSTTDMKRQQLTQVLLGLVVLVLIWLAWPGTKSADDPSNPSKTETRANHKQSSLDSPGMSRDTRQRRLRNPNSAVEDGGIDRILTNQALDDDEAARMLREIAEDQGVPSSVRKDAMEHGVLLNVSEFATMAADPELPEEMAEALFDAVRNHGDDLPLQLRTLMDFINHPSAEIREDTKDTLAFLLGDDLGKDDVESLTKKAAEELAELEAEKLKR